MDSKELVASAIAVYAQARTYRDTGCVVTETTAIGGGKRPARSRAFRTAFVRPDRMCLEAWNPLTERRGYRSAAWINGGDLRVWSETSSSGTVATTWHWALLRAVSLDGRSALDVHGLLVPELSAYSWLAHPVGETRLDDDELDGHPCYRVGCRCAWWDRPLSEDEQSQVRELLVRLGDQSPSMEPPRHFPSVLWLDRKTLLVRRVESRWEDGSYSRATVATFTPEVDVPISDAELRFEPPTTADAQL